ncbi:uncharacterized protein L969DRAFT_53020 [Mixia osmundae IAM 14324]|uniref:GTP cyclohydrolase II n=1 Tax=Mixia osmundae (strain CBS 9802 / IAM 14324 / JCM 22182 / KY 12970) TaxID=764103 RepID=G7DX52_MIXOS|nr:uncharacterized protein L969DRAFT_53020 [Mixia osmundae IAM 14324]KEI37299.1 hypothetical protein L969DRAFT_53020 [Mixia osmundae IAM 14324]GAA95162.1 hypothetical protein E5Q_01817 [Mixia osmundae IAM 14324]
MTEVTPGDLAILRGLTGAPTPALTRANVAGLAAAPIASSSRDNLDDHSQAGSHVARLKNWDRRPQLDPLILETAALSGPQVTRNHFLHEFYPHLNPYQRCDIEADDALEQEDLAEAVTGLRIRDKEGHKVRLISRQAPRRERLAREERERKEKKARERLEDLAREKTWAKQPSWIVPPSEPPVRARAHRQSTSGSRAPAPVPVPVKVVCHVRTRVPTPHGEMFLHLYRNSKDRKEHLAFVMDRNQLSEPNEAQVGTDQATYIRSRSLDARWRNTETETERLVRGAFVGRLSAAHAEPSTSVEYVEPVDRATGVNMMSEPPLVRIHSECFTGETIGSQRCDCGEQLDEAFRLIATHPSGRGVIVYLRQEGRGIGLLEKLRAYNLQDLGHDTVTANLLLGHGADLRTYDIAAAILRDLGIDQLNLLTNNPDKMQQLEREGISVAERVPMVPRAWRTQLASTHRRRHKRRQEDVRTDVLDFSTDPEDSDSGAESDENHILRRSGVGMIGAGMTQSTELDKYLETKVQRMGHMLDLPSGASSPDLGATRQRSAALRPMASVPRATIRRPSKSKPTHRALAQASIVGGIRSQIGSPEPFLGVPGLSPSHSTTQSKSTAATPSHTSNSDAENESNRMADSIQSIGALTDIHTDPESLDCSEGCSCRPHS